MRPVVICCSQRFKDEVDGFVEFLRRRKILVLYPNFRHHRKKFICKPELQRLKSYLYKNKVPGLVRAHFSQIDQCASMGGVCLVFNPLPFNGQRKKFGYIGSNTQAEIGYANALSILVLLIKPHEEEWILTVVHANDRRRVFTLAHPKANPSDFDAIYRWLQEWLQ